MNVWGCLTLYKMNLSALIYGTVGIYNTVKQKTHRKHIEHQVCKQAILVEFFS